jgi:hypothetical protein
MILISARNNLSYEITVGNCSELLFSKQFAPVILCEHRELSSNFFIQLFLVGEKNSPFLHGQNASARKEPKPSFAVSSFNYKLAWR